MFKFWNWSRDAWTLVVAIIALVQPWIVATYKRLFKGGSVDIHETGLIEIGYSVYGTTIGLIGTLRACDRDLFVQSANLTLIKVKERVQCQLDWGAFRIAKTIIGTTIGESAEVALEVPSGFMISTVEPYHYNILFFDTSIFREVKPILEAVQQSWLAYADQTIRLPSIGGLNNPSHERKIMESLKRAYDKFTSTQEYINAYTKLERLYWEPGAYTITLNVYTSRPNRHYSETWSFNLRDTDIDNLRANIGTTIQEACSMPLTAGQYRFIATPYEY